MPPGKAGAREGSEGPGLRQAGYIPELHDGRWVTLPRFCSLLNGAGSRAGRVRSPANIHLWHGKAANRGAISLPGSDGQRLRKSGCPQSVVVKIAHKPRLTRSELGIHLISVNGNSAATATFRKCCKKVYFHAVFTILEPDSGPEPLETDAAREVSRRPATETSSFKLTQDVLQSTI